MQADGSPDRIGPNAILQVMAAADARVGRASRDALLHGAGLSRYLYAPPRDMVPQRDVARLQRQLREQLGSARAREVAIDAGRRTADYLLAHRIPAVVQRVLRRLPSGLSCRILAGAIARHAWTFAGSGRFSVSRGAPLCFTIVSNPLCSDIRAEHPVCDYFVATFEGLFQNIVDTRIRVVERSCQACGDDACVFDICWS
jgi:divinyl protochlorophyllide a 8-vinyl-reductase